MRTRIASLGAVTIVGVLLGATSCGGGGAGGGGTTSRAGTIAGALVKGPVSGATVDAFAISGGTMGARIGTGSTDASGHFTLSIGDYAGPVMLQARAGSYTDEATGGSMALGPGDVMAAAIPAVAAGAATTGVQVTPLTSMAHARVHAMSGGVTPANVDAANAALGAYFGVDDILHTAPMDPTVQGSGAGAAASARNYGMAIAAMSQYAKEIGMPDSAGLVTAMMQDASDGVMDGRVGGAPIPMGGGMMAGTLMQPAAGTTGLASAMADFVGSARNVSGVALADVQPLVTALQASSGALAGAGGGTAVGMMTGSAFMGPVVRGTVAAYAVAGGAMGAQLGSAPVDGSGGFRLAVGAYAGPVMLRMTGGAFVDEATGTTMSMLAGDALSACVPGVTAGATTGDLRLTPLTTMAQARAATMAGGMTPANMTTAGDAVGAYFSTTDVLHTMPMDPRVAASGANATQDQRNYGMSIAAMSEYAKMAGMTTSSAGMVTVMAQDASDGVMNGMMGSTPISMAGMGGMMGGTMQTNAGTTGLSTAMSAFAGSGANASGVTAADMKPLIDRLAASNGQLPGAGPVAASSSTPTMGM